MSTNMRRKPPGRLVNYLFLNPLCLLLVLIATAACSDGAERPAPLPGEFAITAVTAACEADEAPVRVITWGEAEGADSYLVLLNGERLAEVRSDVTSYEDASPRTPGEELGYVVRAVNAAGVRNSAPFTFSVPAEECATDPEGPGEPGEPSDPADPEQPGEPGDPTDPVVDPPGPVDHLTIELRCTPFAEVHAEWGPVPRVTTYALLQAGTLLHEEEAEEGGGSAVVAPLPGAPFEFTLQARNAVGRETSPVTLPSSSDCVVEQPPVAAGSNEVLLVAEDGTAWGWGRNNDHVLGAGTDTLPRPTQLVNGPTNVRKLLLRNSVGVALSRDGSVESWGTSSEGQLGRAGATTATGPEAIPSLTGIVDIALGEHHALAVDVAGRVWTWGTFLGQLVEEPQLVPQVEGILAVAAGNDVSFALRTDGTVLGWGTNGRDDVLGSGVEGTFPDPSPLPGVEHAVELFAAHATLYVRRDDGSYASLGDSHRSPDRAGVSEWPDLHGLTGLSIGRKFVLALDPQNEVISWGWNVYRQLGRAPVDPGTPDPPGPVPGAPRARAVLAGDWFSVAVDLDGRIHTWGKNDEHELGLDAIDRYRAFTPILLPEEIIAVETSSNFILALSRAGRVYSWGLNDYGQLGRTTAGRIDWRPAAVEGLEDIVQISVGTEYGLALDSAGRVYSWGRSNNGQLGDGTPPGQFRALPAPVSDLTDIVKVSAGNFHALALDASGRIWAWGAGHYGALGQGDEEDRLVPVPVDLPSGTVQDIAAGFGYSLFLANSAFIGGFGSNSSWQLRNEDPVTRTDQLSPVFVAIGLGVKSVFAGTRTGFAINAYGDVYAWGGNMFGITGCCLDILSSPDSVQVPGVNNIDMVAASGEVALYLDSDQGIAYGNGNNFTSQLGLTGATQYTVPEVIPLTGTVSHVTAAVYHSALVLDGIVHVTGRNLLGILGRAPTASIQDASTPDVPPVATGSAGD